MTFDYDAMKLARLKDALARGATRSLAARYAGIAPATLATWLRLEIQGDTQYYGLNEAIQTAEAEAAIGWLEAIDHAAADGHWQAAAWKLERLYPDDYGKRSTTRHEGNVRVSHRIDYARLSDAELDLLIAEKQAQHRLEEQHPKDAPLDHSDYKQLPPGETS